MRYSTVFKFIAVILCAATLLGIVGSAAGIFFLTELGGKTVDEAYQDQLESQAIGYAMEAGSVYVSEMLGGMPRNVINRYWGNDWENHYFDWSRVGYLLYDSDGNILQEQTMPGNRTAEHIFTLPVSGRYMKLVSITPREEYYPQETEPMATDGTQVTVMPSQESTAVHAVIADYADGHREEWPYDGTQLGSLEYSGGNTVTFISNIGELPMGDGWYPNHILFADNGGNIVYEAYDNTMVIQGSSNVNGLIEWYLPAGTVTTAAPVGVTFTEGDYTSYDAIPTQGVTVTSMNVTYGETGGEDIGSEGVSSPDLIGTVFHDHQGNVEFHSKDPMTMDIPAGCIITHISFMDAQNNLVYDAVCPGGVGAMTYDENGYLVFRGAMPGTAVPQETVPEETVETETEAPVEEKMGLTQGEVTIYNNPGSSKILGTLESGQVITILTQVHLNDVSWGMIGEGCWIMLDNVALIEPVATEALAAEETERSDVSADAEETIPEESAEPIQPAQTETIPQETVSPVTEQETVEVAADTGSAAVTAAEEDDQAAYAEAAAYPKEEIEISVYYDHELQQDMVAEFVWETVPEGYVMDVQLAKGALRSEYGWTLLRVAEAFRSVLLEALGICIAVFVLCVVHLCCSAGRTRRNYEVRAGGLNRIPLDLYFGGGCAAEAGLAALAICGSQYLARNDEQLAIIVFAACAYLMSLLLVGFFFAFVAQTKTPGGYWWKNTILGRCCKLLLRFCNWLKKVCEQGWVNGRPQCGRFFRWLKQTCISLWLFTRKTAVRLWDAGRRLCLWFGTMLGKSFFWSTGKLAKFFGMLPITWQFLATGFILVFLLYAMMRTYKVGYILLGFGIFFAVILYAASAFAILLENAKRMSKGDLDTKVDDRMLIGGFKEFAGELNDLADVAVIAAQKQLKSERMKTELITNVSHDIKTPLTSIINYVDLMQKPHTEQQQEQYLEVLDRQSQRLKKLIDDLMEMSKASTGNLAVDITCVDAVETVNQALGEFADKLERAQLTPVFRQPEEPVAMMADGRLVWRVMSNLLGNAVKYALPGTRIYLDLLVMDGKVIISMKNISREELNVNADELMERFVRGDASRNTEGSGLGLNIAQSLMELQKGQLQILVDGDLFKVTLIFPGA